MKIWVALSIGLILLALPVSALADIAPPAQPPGSNPQPGSENTQVRMLAETVLLDVLAGSENSLGKAQVTADFTLRNLGTETEQMAARFPISNNDGFYNYPEIKNLQVKVNGKTVPTRRIQGEDPYYGGDQVPWAEFDVKFPPGEDVNIRVSYQLDGTGYYPFTSFNYILSSGAGWRDSIGEADVIVRLPYTASHENVLLAEDTGYWLTSPGAELEGTEVRWHFDDLEPTSEDNLRVELVAPALWQKVVREQANIEQNPDDGEAWGRLAKAYKESAFLPKEMRPDEGGQALFELSEQAYEKSIQLLPDDADWHAGFAELYFWRHNTYQWENPDDYTYTLRAVELVKRALEINPRTPKALELVEMFEWNDFVARDGEAYDFLLLTATPTAQNTPTSAAALTPTAEQLGASIQTQVAVAAQATANTPTSTVEATRQPTEQPTDEPTNVPATQTQVVAASSHGGGNPGGGTGRRVERVRGDDDLATGGAGDDGDASEEGIRMMLGRSICRRLYERARIFTGKCFAPTIKLGARLPEWFRQPVWEPASCRTGSAGR